MLGEITDINGKVVELETNPNGDGGGGGIGDNSNAVGTLDVGGISTFNSPVTISYSVESNYGDTTFDVAVI